MIHCEAKIQRGQHVPLQDYLVETINVKPLKEPRDLSIVILMLTMECLPGSFDN